MYFLKRLPNEVLPDEGSCEVWQDLSQYLACSVDHLQGSLVEKLLHSRHVIVKRQLLAVILHLKFVNRSDPCTCNKSLILDDRSRND